MSTFLSGVQPTGSLHLGNYLGAIRNWVKMQEKYNCLYFIADLHALTIEHDPARLKENVLETAAALIACGIDPKKSIVFNQSTVTGHSELAWILGCHTPLGWLNRMTQFKEKAGKDKEKAVLGLYSYPVLMAADILVYRPSHVPVGEDQKQHIELTRDIAGAFNRYYGQDFFPIPEPVIVGEATRVMSLRDGTKKMSKSDASDYSRINLTDDAETIALKFQKAKSDSVVGISYDPEARPEVANLVNIYCALSEMGRDAVIEKFAGQGFSDFKKELAALAEAKLAPITSRMRELMKDKGELVRLLKEGNAKAREIAGGNMKKIHEIVGLGEP